MRNALALYRCRGETGILKDPQVTDYGCNHREESEISRCEQACKHRDRDHNKDKLRTLGRDRDESSRNGATFEVVKKMLSRKVLLM